MRLRTVAVVGALMATLACESAFAQDAAGIASELERTARTSPQEKRQYADNALTEINETVRQIAKLLDGARRAADVEAIQCLTGRLTSVRALQQVTDGAVASMRDALEKGEGERADHEFRKIAVAVSKTRMLAAEAERCALGQELEAGTTLVEWASTMSVGEEAVFDSQDLDALDVGYDPIAASPFL